MTSIIDYEDPIIFDATEAEVNWNGIDHGTDEALIDIDFHKENGDPNSTDIAARLSFTLPEAVKFQASLGAQIANAGGQKTPEQIANEVIAANYINEDEDENPKDTLQAILDLRAIDADDLLSLLRAAVEQARA